MHRRQRGSTGGGWPELWKLPACYWCRRARMQLLPIFIHGWKKPSLLAKLVYREDDVIFLFQ